MVCYSYIWSNWLGTARRGQSRGGGTPKIWERVKKFSVDRKSSAENFCSTEFSETLPASNPKNSKLKGKEKRFSLWFRKHSSTLPLRAAHNLRKFPKNLILTQIWRKFSNIFLQNRRKLLRKILKNGESSVTKLLKFGESRADFGESPQPKFPGTEGPPPRTPPIAPPLMTSYLSRVADATYKL